jgi:trk system potassium uptake protein TrkA
MRIIVAGGGEIGFYLASLLAKESHEVTLIDLLKDKVNEVESILGIATIQGDSTSYKTLLMANVETADLLIAVTSSESINITTSIIAKKLGAKFTIARISNKEYLIDKHVLDLKDFGIDELISPESLAAREVKYILKEPSLTEIFDLEDGKLTMMGLRLESNAPIINKTVLEIAQFNQDKTFIISAIHRKGEIITPKGSTRFEANDYLYFIALNGGKNKVLELAGKKPIEIKSVLVIGGSRTGAYIAHRLSSKYSIKIIERDIERCKELALKLPNVQIVNGDCTNIKFLEEERISSYDAFIAVTGNSETNIFNCLLARDFGVKKTIAMVENIGLFDHSQKIGVDTLINKKIATANFLFRKISKGEVVSYLYGIDAEIFAFTVKKNSSLKNKLINEIPFPENAIVCGVIRNGKGYITLGDFKFLENDKVLVLSTVQTIKKVEAFFR